MKVVIPMGGAGVRFIEAGYPDPKPLIRVDDVGEGKRRIIEHVVGMFEPDDEFVFICNNRHLQFNHMGAVIESLCPEATILGMPIHKKGPVFTASMAYEHIQDNEPVIVAYCDGAIKWDRQAFEAHVESHELDGCLLTHSGFHPHVLSTTRMAFIRENGGFVDQVQEKKSFTDDPQSEHASSGVYYFRRGSDLKKYFDEAMTGEGFNGEFYVTLVYNLMIRDGLKVGYFDTPGVAILGTPGEVSNFAAWSIILRGEQIKDENELLNVYQYWKAYHAD